MKREIKAVIFDIGGVLELAKENLKLCHHRLHHIGVHEHIAGKLKIPLDQYFDSIDTNYALSIEGKISKQKLLKEFSKNLKISEKKIEKLYFQAYVKKFNFNKQLFKQALKLKKIDFQIAILSDQWQLSKKAHLPKKLQKNFKPIIISCDVGMRKPNPKIYKLILKKLKLKPSEVLLIDNQIWNIKPAKKLGMKTILFKNNNQLFENKTWRNLFKK